MNGFWVAVVVAIIAGLAGLGIEAAVSNNHDNARIRLARAEACRTVEDQSLRTLCIVESR